MKLLRAVRLTRKNGYRPNNSIKDLSDQINDLTPETFSSEYLEKVKNINLSKQKEINSETRLGPFINNPKNYFCGKKLSIILKS